MRSSNVSTRNFSSSSSRSAHDDSLMPASARPGATPSRKAGLHAGQQQVEPVADVEELLGGRAPVGAGARRRRRPPGPSAPATRTWKNSSRFWLKMARNLARSSSGHPLVLGEGEHAGVEVEPGQLAVAVPGRRRVAVRRRVGGRIRGRRREIGEGGHGAEGTAARGGAAARAREPSVTVCDGRGTLGGHAPVGAAGPSGRRSLSERARRPRGSPRSHSSSRCSRSASRTTRSRLRRNWGSCGGSSTRRAMTRDRKSSMIWRSPKSDWTSQWGATGPEVDDTGVAAGRFDFGLRRRTWPTSLPATGRSRGQRPSPRSAALTAELGGERLLLAVALDDDLDRVARLVARATISPSCSLDVISSPSTRQDHVALLDAGRVGPAVGHDLDHERALVGLDARAARAPRPRPCRAATVVTPSRGVSGVISPSPSWIRSMIGLAGVDGDGEADVLAVLDDRGVDADHRAARVDQRAARSCRG